MLEDEVPLEQNRLQAREQRLVAVSVRPASLHHTHRGVGEVMHRLMKKVGARGKIGVENRDQLTVRRSQPVL